ncbi:MAG: DNA polymerase III subunit delta [Bacillota bacterium]
MNKKVEKVLNLKINKIDNLYIIYSTEEYLLDKFERNFKNKFIKKEDEDFNLTYIRREEEVFKNIVNKGSTLPLMSEKRFIMVKAGNIFKTNIPNFELFKKFAKDIPDTTVLIIFVNEDISKNKRMDKLKKHAEVINIKAPKYKDLNKWINDQFTKRGKRIDYRGIRLLEKMFNNNLQQLDSEIDKICTFINNKNKVEVSDIKNVITKDRRLKENIIFDFLDSLSKKQKDKSVYLFHQMIANGEIPQIIFAMIARRIKLMLIIKDLKKQGINHEKIATKIGEHPYPVKKIYGYVDSFTFGELENMLNEFLKADIDYKSGSNTVENAIQNAIISI